MIVVAAADAENRNPISRLITETTQKVAKTERVIQSRNISNHY
jgi:hypothetical protein